MARQKNVFRSEAAGRLYSRYRPDAYLRYAIPSLPSAPASGGAANMANSILQVEELVKRYGGVEAVRGVSFNVEEGEVFGLLGPNGAGKTTTVEILEGLRNLDSGRVSVCGLDPQCDSTALKHEIGAALQSTSLPDKLRVIEALRLFGSFYKRSEEHTSELQSPDHLVCRLLLEKKKQPSKSLGIIIVHSAHTKPAATPFSPLTTTTKYSHLARATTSAPHTSPRYPPTPHISNLP